MMTGAGLNVIFEILGVLPHQSVVLLFSFTEDDVGNDEGCKQLNIHI